MPPSEQRRHPRIRRRFSLTIGVRGRSLSAVTEDLSQSGVLVRCNEILQPGTAVSGTLDLEGQALSFGAVVRWSRSASRTNSNERKHSMGLAFLSAPGARYVEYFERILGEQALAAEAARTPAGARPLPTPPVEQSAKAPPPRSTPAEPIVGAGARVPVRAAESPRRAEKAPEAQATPAPSGLVVGLVGRMESTSKPTNANLSGAVPFAPAAAALLFEQAAVQAVTGVLPAGTQTLGLSLKVNMNRPPHVMLGAKLEAVATLLSISADRTLRFQVELREGERLVASGEHQRVLVAG